MASISTDPNGNRTIQFCGDDGKRRSIRIGKVPKKTAEAMKTKVEHLSATTRAKLALDPDTAAWLAGIGDDIYSKLAAVGLVPPRERRTVGELCEWYLDRRRRDGQTKPATLVNLETVTNDVRGYFTESADLRDVTPELASAFKSDYRERGLALATASRRLTTVRSIFTAAVNQKWIVANPFAGVRSTNTANNERQHYVSRADLGKLLAACRSEQWRLVLVLSRLCGMRCPSEVLMLRWDGIDFAAGSMVIHSPKTEHIPTKGRRVMPIFPEVRRFLESARRDGEYVIAGAWGDKTRAKANTDRGWVNCNLRSGFTKIVRRAKLAPWPRLFHNLRASCETDLVEVFPLHVVAAWLGNTPSIATRHYLQVTEAHFQRAVHFPVQSVAFPDVQGDSGRSGRERDELQSAGVNAGERSGMLGNMGEEGLEPTRNSVAFPSILKFHVSAGAESGAIDNDPRLASLVAAWPTLPDAVRAALCDLVAATQRKAA